MKRIVELIERLEHVADERAREDARALVTEVLAFHREGIVRLTDVMKKQDPALLEDAARDPLVASLFELHDIDLGKKAPLAQLLPVDSLVRKRASTQTHDDADCDLCGEAAGPSHPHLVDIETRAIACACRACAITGAGTKWRRIPEGATRIASLAESDDWWNELGLPIGLAFFVVRGEDRPISALYPGAAGATEAEVPREVWTKIAAAHPEVARLEPHIQALLVDRTEGAREHWIVGVDRCFALTARLREKWSGLMGGDDVRVERKRFFSSELRA